MTEPTTEQIKDWKEKYGEDNLVKISTSEGKCTVVRTNPSVRTVDAALTAGRNGGVGFGKTLHANLALYTSPGCTDADMLGFYTQMGDLIQVNDAKVEKL